MKDEITIISKNIKDTENIAKKISNFCCIPCFIGLKGDLGSGKTTFVRFLINFLARRKLKVQSPTFPIVQIYELENFRIWHYDLYRINEINELLSLDFELSLSDFVIVEWFDKFTEICPRDRIEVIFSENDSYEKLITVRLTGNKIKKKKYLWT